MSISHYYPTETTVRALWRAIWCIGVILLMAWLVGMLAPQPLQAQGDICANVTQIPTSECEALVALYNKMGGMNWGSDWLTTPTPCSWHGVTCSADGTPQHVVELDLFMAGGDLPGEIGQLTHLTVLDIARSQVWSLPPEIGNLTNLKVLDVAGNPLIILPPEIGNLSSLERLNAGYTRLTSLPPEIGNLSSLKNLYLGLNLFTDLPATIGNLNNLEHLDLSEGELENLPPEIGGLSSLVHLNVSRNQLANLPAEIGNLVNLEHLDLSINHTLAGPLPTGMVQLTQLEYFNFAATDLCEPDDPAFQAWLGTIDMLYGEGTICSPPPTLPVANAGRGYGGMTGKSIYFDAAGSYDPDGTLVLYEWDFDSDGVFDVSSAEPTATHVYDDPYADSVILRVTSSDGGTATDTTFARIETFDCNSVSEIPASECEALVSLYSATRGPGWVYSDWFISPNPCEWYGVFCSTDTTLQHVVEISLVTNGLVGPVPSEIENFTYLQRLDLTENFITSLPPEIGNLANLESLAISLTPWETLSGHVGLTSLPPEIGNLTNLQGLGLPRNQLTSLPPEIGNLTNLQGLALDDNRLASLPPEIGNLTNLKTLSLEDNLLTTVPDTIGNLSSLERLGIYRNQLVTVPAEIGNLTNLQSLYLHENQLTSLPDEISNLINLLNLDVSENVTLSGRLPDGMMQLTSLERFYFRNTRLCEPGYPAFQNWLDSIPRLSRTNAICPAAQAELTIVKDAQPNKPFNFRFTGDLGDFQLDNAQPDDGDAYGESQTFTLSGGTGGVPVTIREEMPGNWHLAEISCDPAANATLDLANQQVSVSLAADEAVRCTFTNRKRSIIRAWLYDDANGNARRESDEPAREGWTVRLYDMAQTLVAEQVTNSLGKVSFTGVAPGNYTVCEALPQGWFNTRPGLIDATYNQPCYLLTLGIDVAAEVSFGNNTQPLARAAEQESGESVIYFPAPDVEEDDYAAAYSDAAWLNTPLANEDTGEATDEAADSLYLPLIPSAQ